MNDVALTGSQGMQHSCMQPVALLLTVKEWCSCCTGGLLHSRVSQP